MKTIPFQSKQNKVKINVAVEYQLSLLKLLKLDYPTLKIRISESELRQIDNIFLEILQECDQQDYFFNSASLFFSDAIFYSVRDKKPLTREYLKRALIYYLNEILEPTDIEKSVEKLNKINEETPCKVILFRKA